MKIFSLPQKIMGKIVRSKQQSVNDPYLWKDLAPYFRLGQYPRGDAVSLPDLDSVFGTIPIIFACIRVIANALTVKLEWITLKGEKKTSPELEEFLREPFPGQGYSRWLTMLVGKLLVWGEMRLVQPEENVLAFFPASPTECSLDTSRGRKEFRFQGMLIPPEQVREIILSGVRGGESPVRAVWAEVLAAHHAGWVQITNSLRQGSAKRGFFRKKTPPASVEEFQQELAMIVNALTSAEEAGRPAYFAGDVEWQGFTQGLVDTSILEAVKISRDAVAMAFGVPLALLSSEESRYANYTEQLRQFYEWTLRPLWRLIADELTIFVAPRLGLRDGKFEFNEEDCWVITELQQTEAERVAKLAGVPVMTPNEARQQLGLPPVSGGDAIYIPATYFPLGSPVSSSSDTSSSASVPGGQMNSWFFSGKMSRVGSSVYSREARRAMWQGYERTRASWERRLANETQKYLDWWQGQVEKNLPEIVKSRSPGEIYNREEVRERGVKYRMGLYPAVWADGREAGALKLTREEASGVRELDRKTITLLRQRAAMFAEKIEGITAAELEEIIRRGITEGWDLTGFTEEIRKAGLFSWDRAVRIARTEVGGVLNGGECQYYAEQGVAQKEWLATQDDRVRDGHSDADGQVVAISEYFLVGGERLFYPGDPAGSPENILNCRCTIIPV